MLPPAYHRKVKKNRCLLPWAHPCLDGSQPLLLYLTTTALAGWFGSVWPVIKLFRKSRHKTTQQQQQQSRVCHRRLVVVDNTLELMLRNWRTAAAGTPGTQCIWIIGYHRHNIVGVVGCWLVWQFFKFLWLTWGR